MDKKNKKEPARWSDGSIMNVAKVSKEEREKTIESRKKWYSNPLIQLLFYAIGIFIVGVILMFVVFDSEGRLTLGGIGGAIVIAIVIRILMKAQGK